MSSTPKHILLYQAFGWTPPTFMHMPLLLGKDGKKLSKRKNPTSIFYFRDSGYLPEALVNFLTLMGYSLPSGKELYTLDEIIETFDPARIGTSGAFFDIQKLDWTNQKKLIESTPVETLWSRLKRWTFNDEFMNQLMPLVHTRIRTFGDFIDLCDFFFINKLDITPEKLIPKDTSPELVAAMLQVAIWSMDKQEDWTGVGLEKAITEITEIFGVHIKKVVLPCFFVAIMGKLQGPPLFQSVTLLGKDRTRVRLMQGIDLVGGLSGKRTAQLTKCWEKQDCKTFILPEAP